MTELPEELKKAERTAAQITDKFVWERNRFDNYIPSIVVASFLEAKKKELKDKINDAQYPDGVHYEPSIDYEKIINDVFERI